MEKIRANDLLEGDLWPEPVRVLQTRDLGDRVQIQALGLERQTFYDRLLSRQDLAKIRRFAEASVDFRGDGERFFLAIEAHRSATPSSSIPSSPSASPKSIPSPTRSRRSIYSSPRIRFLLADDPGAGKTIMAGLLLKELKYRGLVERTLIVVPGHLKDQWRREMKERFGETFIVVDRGVINAAWGQNVWQEQVQVRRDGGAGGSPLGSCDRR